MTRQRLVPIGAAVVLLVTGLLADARTPYALERDIGRWIFDLPDGLTTPLEAVMQAGTQLAILLVALALVVTGRYRAAGAAALAGVGGWLAASLLKDVLDRPRPTPATLGRVPREIIDNASWPSSHATIAFALATVLLLTVAQGRVGRGLVIAVAVLVAVGRVHLGVHWGLDVLGGAALGVLAGSVAVMVVKPT
ncbi:MAG TPA: phosphatase PAP2 family protein [Acidimicrobiales bacterium]